MEILNVYFELLFQMDALDPSTRYCKPQLFLFQFIQESGKLSLSMILKKIKMYQKITGHILKKNIIVSYQLPSVIMNLCADGVGSVINVVMNFKFLYNTSGV